MKEVKQQKLTDEQRGCLASINRDLIYAFNWAETPDGIEFWDAVFLKLKAMELNGTTDGKPYVESVTWRVPTDEDAKRRPECRYRDNEANSWREGTLLYVDHLNVNERYRFTVLNNVKSIVPYRYCEIVDKAKV